MPDRPIAGRWMIRVSVVLAFLIIVGAMALSLYLLVDHHERPQNQNELLALTDQLAQANRRIEELQQRLPTPQKETSAEAYQQDMKQHELLLSELRTERSEIEDRIKYASDLLREAKETEDRTRAAAALFLGIFGAVATILLGQGYWWFRGWQEKADQSLESIQGVKPDIHLIRETRKTLESKLPKYIDDVRNDLVQTNFPKGPALAKMHEIDHLAYLSNAEMRFKETRTAKEANQYLLALLEAARGHSLQQNYFAAEDRMHEFFRNIAQYPDAVDKPEIARGHSILAYVYHRRLLQIASFPSWIRMVKAKEMEQLQKMAFAEVKKSRECDKDWWHGHFVEAMLYSLQYAPEQIAAPDNSMFLDGQRKAIAIYQHLTQLGAGVNPGMGSWQNLACCRKRVAEITGQQAEYDHFKAELQAFPSDQQISQAYTQNGRMESEEIFLWHAMLQDEELFGKVDKINAGDYCGFWRDLLTAKVKSRDWEEDLREMKRKAKPKMDNWLI